LGVDPCDECRRGIKKGIIETLKCETDEGCKTEQLLPGNLLAWDVIALIAPGLIDGFGGVSFAAIEFAFKRFRVEPWEEIPLTEKIMVYVEEKMEHIKNKPGE